MTVVAWDGKTLATDKQATNSGLAYTVTKSMKLETGEVLAWTDNADSGLMLVDWYKSGADPAKWPECQKNEDRWAKLIVIKDKRIHVYERQPIPIIIEDKIMAWGSGRDFALAAMAMGADARKAVEIASIFETGCGRGVDVYEAV